MFLMLAVMMLVVILSGASTLFEYTTVTSIEKRASEQDNTME